MVTINKEGIIAFIKSLELDLHNSLMSKETIVGFKKFISDSDEDYVSFSKSILEVRKCLKKDLEFFLLSDPAADSEEEVILAYPGYRAIAYHRVAHIFYQMKLLLQARIISEEAHFLTGIDIHPGASIGCPFFIDHGTGIVVGETTIIKDYVKLYQGVTLGALSLSQGNKIKGVKRHPTIGNHVTIYAGASILGGDVVIGDNVVIGSNVFLLESIPSNHKVVNDKPKLLIIKKESN